MFEDGDLICVANGSDAPQICTVSVDGKRNATFTTSLSGPLKAVYPADAAGLDTDGKTITGVRVSTVQSGEFADANICMAEMMDGNDESLSFENKTAVFRITPKAEDISYLEVSAEASGLQIANREPTGSSPSNLNKVRVEVPDTNPPTEFFVSILVPAGLTIGDLAFSDGTNEKTVTGDKASEPVAVNTLCNVTVPVFVQSVTLDRSILEITVGDHDEKLIATISPANATDNKVNWSSNQEGVATVDQEGKVHAVAPGTATITATTTDGGKTATCTVTVKEHEYVVIGGLKWATCNIGATNPYDYGWYFSWGNTEGYIHDDDNDKWIKASDGTTLVDDGKFNNTNYNSTPGQTLTTHIPPASVNDAARINWGGDWRMPTREDFTALANECKYGVYTSGYFSPSSADNADSISSMGIYYCSNYSDGDGKQGLLFCDGTNKLFFPAAGYGDGTSLPVAGSQGYYWSSTWYSANSANFLNFYSTRVSPRDFNSRYLGFPVRPVSDL